MQFQHLTLPNHLKLTIIHLPNARASTILALVKVGSRYETSHNNGIAHCIEHMLFKGTTNRPNSELISSEIDQYGADANAFTSKEYTGYYIKIANQFLPNAIDIVGDLLSNPLFDSVELEKEKGVILEEINMYQDMPMRHVNTIFESLILKDHPLSLDTAGSRDSVMAITDKLCKSFYNQYYSCQNTQIVVAGDFETDSIQAAVQKSFQIGNQSLQPNSVNAQVAATAAHDASLSENNNRYTHLTKDIDQYHIIIGTHGYPLGHKQRYALSIFNTLFGGSMSSRLFFELRERRGLCYYVTSDIDTYQDVGIWSIQAGVDKLRLIEALEAVIGILQETISNGVGETEIERAKKYLQGKLSIGLEESKGVANLYGISLLLEDRVRTEQEIYDFLEAVTSTDVQQVVQDILSKRNYYLAILGPDITSKQQSQITTLLHNLNQPHSSSSS
jgi:predicted Zn-dependent peptidase